MEFDKIESYAPIVLRFGIAFVFLWFAINQFMSPIDWTGFVPEQIAAIADPTMLVYGNAVFELVFGILLLLGLWPRITALLLGMHLIGISIGLGYNSIMIRDIGLSLATLAIAMHGPDRFCITKSRGFF